MRYKLLLVLLLVVTSYCPVIKAQVVVNELMSSNSFTISDEDGDYPDWFELFNAGLDTVNLRGFGISNDPLVRFKWTMPEVILLPQDHLLIFASGKNRKEVTTGHLHTNFKLSSNGEFIVITDSLGDKIDQISFGIVGPDDSYGRYPDGDSSWVIFLDATPGDSNTTVGYSGITAEPLASLPGGFYSSYVTVALSAGSPNDTIYYTLDGSEPTDTSEIYKGSIEITSTKVLRAKAFKSGFLPSKTLTNTYLIDFTTTLPVISLSTAPANLFDEHTGIYVLGDNAQSEFPYWGANFWQDWERPVHVELFEIDGTQGFSVDAGIKIFGSWSRLNDQKSFAIHFRGEYGLNNLDYKLFDNLPYNSYKSFVLRNSGGDWNVTMFRDALMQSLLYGIDIDKQEYRPSVVLINGIYWGILNIREKISEHFLAQHHNVDPDSLDILEKNASVIQGTRVDYIDLRSFVGYNDLSIQSNFEYVETQMDVDEFTRYFVSEIYFENIDWPGNNIRYWQSNNNGKWRWILFDTDRGFGLFAPNGFSHNTLEWATSKDGTGYNQPWSTFFLRHLLGNLTFKYNFINCFADYSNTIFSPLVVINKIDSIKSKIELEIPRHGIRWGLYDLNKWLDNVQDLRDFANQRIAYMRDYYIKKFALSGLSTVNLSISDTTKGNIKLNSLNINNSSWSGTYFLDVPIKIIAQPKAGYRFVKWDGSMYSSEDTLMVTLNDTLNLNAVFEVSADTVLPKIVINEINYNSISSFDTEDWIELYNNNGSPVDISGWIFKDSNDNHIFTIPQGTILNIDAYLVLCIDTALFKPLFTDVNNFTGNVGFGLSGSGELIRLYDDQMTLIDSLTYNDKAPWPIRADGEGASLSLKNPDLDNSLGKNWEASVGHGTPGKVNDIYIVIPVELTSFTAEAGNRNVVIKWTTATEKNNRGFYVERDINGAWESIHFTPGSGTTVSYSSYVYNDILPNEVESCSIKYRLQQVDFDGSFTFSDIIEVQLNLLPDKFQLEQNYPNPFNPVTSIHYTVGSKQSLTLKVYDLLGREIQTIVNEEKPAGFYNIDFDASNLPSGVYFYQLKAGNFVATKKMVLMK
jgi:hypothetical protein